MSAVLSPAQSVTLPERPGPPEPARTGLPRGPRLAVLVLGLIAGLAALAFPFAPVQQPEVRYSWTAADGAAAIPLMPYQPVALTAEIDCAAARADGLVLATVPPRPDPAAEPLYGLRIDALDGELRVASAGVDLGPAPLPAGDCTIAVTSDPDRTVVSVDGVPAITRAGDVRPDVAGAFSDARAGVDLALTADTRFQTTISPLKAALAGLCVLALLGMLVALGRADRRAGETRRVALLPRRWWLPRLVDVAVTALLGVWWVVGAITVDDGYIAGIVRSNGSNGFVGNVYRWLNAPEAPFSWFYELYYPWSLISSSTLWMRLPSTLLGLACWGLLSRLVLPRLGRFAARRSVPWLAALGFGTWWIPLNLGIRPEPWLSVGTLVVFLAVERAIATRRVLPLAVGLVVAGATAALTPAGVIAFVPFLAAALPVLRLLRSRTDLGWPALLVALAAATGSAVLFMVYDQSFAGMLEAVRVRGLIGGGSPSYQEFERYAALLEPGSFQGSIGRRAAVLVTLLAAVGVLIRRRGRGIATGPARRLVVGFLVALALLTVSPTKWTQHFGDFAGYGTAVIVLGLVAWSGPGLRARALIAGTAAVTLVSWLVLAGSNLWPFVSDWYEPTFSTIPPQLAGRSAASLVLGLGGLVVLLLLARSVWARSGGAADPPAPRWVPAPARPVVVLLVAVLALQVSSLARVAVEQPRGYTLAADAVATAAGGEPCGLQALLSVETDPAAGLLRARPGDGGGGVRPVDVGGRTLPGISVAGTVSTGWFVLDAAQRDGTLPVVVTTSGELRTGDVLTMEFADGDRVLDRRRLTSESIEPRDVRQPAPGGADAVRLVVDAPTAGSRAPALVSLPRVPRLTPMLELLPPGTSAILDWPVAFPFGCLTPEPLPLGTAGLAQWRVGPDAASDVAGITYAPGFGGPFAAPRLLVTEQRMATYLRGDPIRDAVQLYRWVPITPLVAPRPVITERSVTGWAREGHARVPGLDPVG